MRKKGSVPFRAQLNEKLKEFKEKASQVDELTERLARLESLVVADQQNNDD